MLVHAGVEAHADGAADGLGHLALVDGAQAGLARVLDAAHGGHELGDEGEVLPSPVLASLSWAERQRDRETHPVVIQRVEAQHVDDVRVGPLALAPLAHLGRAQVARGVDVAGAPAARHLAQVVLCRGRGAQVPDVGARAVLLLHDLALLLGRERPAPFEAVGEEPVERLAGVRARSAVGLVVAEDAADCRRVLESREEGV